MILKMKKLVTPVTIIYLLLASGCAMVGVMGTPTRHERKIPAEYDLTEHKKQNILVLVDSADWSNVPLDLKEKLTKSLNIAIKERLKLDKDYIINFKNEQDFLANQDKSSSTLPYDVGKNAGADFVLLTELYAYETINVTHTSYYKAEVSGKVALFDIANNVKVWPVNDKGKFVRVGFDIEQGGYEVVIKRLAASFAHCTVRYLYDCPVAKYKHFDDRTISQLEQWDDMF